MESTVVNLDVRPYTPDPGDLCGRCASDKSSIVATRHYATRWVINLCDRCLTPEERAALRGALDDGLYLSGLR